MGAVSQIETEELDDVHVIKLPKALRAEDKADIGRVIKSWLLVAKDLHVLDLSGVMEIHHTIRADFIQFKNALVKNEKTLASINVSDRLLREFKDFGLTDVFKPVGNMNDARRLAGIKVDRPVPKVDAEFLKPFIEGTIETLSVQCSVPVKPGKPSVKGVDQVEFDIGIAGVINLTSEAFHGTILLAFGTQTFISIYNKMVGEDIKELNQEIQDGAAELLNIIYGHAKRILTAKDYKLDKAIPTVLMGEGMTVKHFGSSKAIVIPFESEFGPVLIEIILDPNWSQKAS
jgi:chemotaxis protein CheX